MTLSVTSAYHAEITLHLKRQRRRDPLEAQMEPMPDVQCASVSPEEDYCVLRYGHTGPCSWRKKAQ